MHVSGEDVWTFADFRAGHSFGEMSLVLDESRLDQWRSIYGDGGAENADAGSRAVPRGLLVTCMMEAYLGLIGPRPPGNIHASQKIAFGPCRPRLGDTLSVRASCLDKIERKGRGWVTFEVAIDKDGDNLLRGEIRTIWAK